MIIFLRRISLCSPWRLLWDHSGNLSARLPKFQTVWSFYELALLRGMNTEISAFFSVNWKLGFKVDLRSLACSFSHKQECDQFTAAFCSVGFARYLGISKDRRGLEALWQTTVAFNIHNGCRCPELVSPCAWYPPMENQRSLLLPDWQSTFPAQQKVSRDYLKRGENTEIFQRTWKSRVKILLWLLCPEAECIWFRRSRIYLMKHALVCKV